MRGASFAATLILGFAMACLFALPAVAAEPAPPKGTLKLSKADSAVVKQKLQVDARAQEAKARADFQAKKTAFLGNQKTQLDSRNARTRAEMSRLNARAEQIDKIRAEASQLNSRYALASTNADERDKIDRRAEELTAQLKNLGN